MFDFIDDIIEFVGDLFDSGADEVIENLGSDTVSAIAAEDVLEEAEPVHTIHTDDVTSTESQVSFKGEPSRKGSCYDCACQAFIPKPGKPTTCVCGHSIYRHHIYLGH